MEINFVFSEIYHKNLNRHSEKKHEWSIVKEHCEKFVLVYQGILTKMLMEIQVATGIPFKFTDNIPVYFVGWAGPSFSNPLTLNCKKDLKLMFVTLCHELLHKTFRNEGPSEELENKINNFVEIVMSRLGIEANEQIEILRTNSRNKNGNPESKREI